MNTTWSQLRLRDRIKRGVRVLFVGINPGIRSALTGHHFAGYSNRFWMLLTESGLVPEPITHLDDDRLPEWGFGITNLIARPSSGIGDLSPREYVEAWEALDRKIRRYRPDVLALVGVTLYRTLQPLIERGAERGEGAPRATSLAGCSRLRQGYGGPPKLEERRLGGPRHSRMDSGTRHVRARGDVLGAQPQVVHGARVFVLPNPSGRNANFSYGEMLDVFVSLQRSLSQGPKRRVGINTRRALRR